MLKTMFIVLCLLMVAAANAQERSEETVYLKNGSVIKGTIIEEKDDQLKIETPNGSVFTIGSYDVEKIVRNSGNARNYGSQIPTQRTQRSQRTQMTPQQESERETYTQRPRRRTLNGNNSKRYEIYDADADYGYYGAPSIHRSLYKGFIDFGYSSGTGGNKAGNNDEYEIGRFEFSTSHGIVFNRNYNYISAAFLGFGIGGQIYSEEDALLYLFPFFIHTKIHFIDSRVTPFLDFKLGYSWGTINSWDEMFESDSGISIGGLYVAPAVGVRFATGNKSGISLSLGYTLQKINSISFSSDGYKVSANDINISMPAISMKLGFDF